MLRHQILVIQERFAIAAREIELRVVRRDRVVDRLAEVPDARRGRRGNVAARKLLRRDERNPLRRRVTDRLGQDADDALEVADRAQTTVPPRRVARARAHREARLAFLEEPLVHRRADHVESHHDHGIEVVVERVAERRREDHRAGGTGLVMVVHDDRMPLPEHEVIDVLRLVQIRHERITIVVVARVLVVQQRDVHVARERVVVLHVPVRDELHAVGIRVHGEDDVILEDALRLVVVAREELVGRLDQLVRAEDFRRVQTAVEPNDRLAFLRQRVGLLVRQVFALRQLHRDVPVLLEQLEVGRIGDDRRHLGTTFTRLADFDRLHAVGLAVDLLPVREELVVVRQPVVVADVVAEELLRRRDMALRADRARREHQRQQGGSMPGAESPR